MPVDARGARVPRGVLRPGHGGVPALGPGADPGQQGHLGRGGGGDGPVHDELPGDRARHPLPGGVQPDRVPGGVAVPQRVPQRDRGPVPGRPGRELVPRRVRRRPGVHVRAQGPHGHLRARRPPHLRRGRLRRRRRYLRGLRVRQLLLPVWLVRGDDRLLRRGVPAGVRFRMRRG